MKGQGLVEYGLILVLVAVVIIVILSLIAGAFAPVAVVCPPTIKDGSMAVIFNDTSQTTCFYDGGVLYREYTTPRN